MTQIVIDRLQYAYPSGSAPALGGVSLDVDPGEFVVIAGISGSGKSTLLRAIAGLVPHFHGGELSGRLTVAGFDTRDHGPGDLAAVVGTLTQDPETQIVLGTVRGELGFAAENRGWTQGAVARAVEETALALAIDQLLDRSTAELSGGELQRVALGATLAPRPAIVCLDEPTSQLDPVAGDELIGLLRRLNEDFDTTVLLSEHRLERCLPYADRVVALDAGRISFDGPPDRFLQWALTDAPSLVTPGAALLSQLGIDPVPGVKAARAALRRAGHELPDGADSAQSGAASHVQKEKWPRLRREVPSERAALKFSRVWHEIKDGPAILRGLNLEVQSGERVALMGRNGAGKSTLLRHAAGLMQPTRGSVGASGRVALVMQNPTDYLVHERVADEASPRALQRFGLDALSERHPRDLSGGEKQRLALAIVLDEPEGGEPASVVCMDEPTRGMDRAAKLELGQLVRDLDGAAIVATHDPEFAASFADRVVLLADGAVIADGPVAEILATGMYFTTETARIISGALTPADGVAALAPGRSPWRYMAHSLVDPQRTTPAELGAADAALAHGAQPQAVQPHPAQPTNEASTGAST